LTPVAGAIMLGAMQGTSDRPRLPRLDIYELGAEYGISREEIDGMSLLAFLAIRAAAPRAARTDERPTRPPESP
jgi:TPP-dependent pyruvate/acetoin dehydrogenase alpha subunit